MWLAAFSLGLSYPKMNIYSIRAINIWFHVWQIRCNDDGKYEKERPPSFFFVQCPYGCYISTGKIVMNPVGSTTFIKLWVHTPIVWFLFSAPQNRFMKSRNVIYSTLKCVLFLFYLRNFGDCMPYIAMLCNLAECYPTCLCSFDSEMEKVWFSSSGISWLGMRVGSTIMESDVQ